MNTTKLEACAVPNVSNAIVNAIFVFFIFNILHYIFVQYIYINISPQKITSNREQFII
ncbi:hypothetical protein VAE308_180011 [Vibrio aestuarianus]|nr:hypothetical protein VAE308_180011 [Vibrio aestuarianus]